MNISKTIHLFTVGAALLCTMATAREIGGIDVYGYFQSELMYERSIMKIAGQSDTTSRTSTQVSELDLYLNKQITQKISALVDLQFTENYSTTKSWGDMDLDQVWAKFDLSKMFVIKVGHIVPTFNNFNEIKSRFPLIPYVFRPAIYETFYAKMVGSEWFLPLHAALQVNGTFSSGKMKFDYAVFGGNSEFIKSKTGTEDMSSAPVGTDTTLFKLVGGRLGIRAHDVKLGVSGTYDYTRNDDLNSAISTANSMMKQFLGNNAPVISFIDAMPRCRLGVDLSYSRGRINFESEYIYVYQNPKGKVKNQIKAAHEATKNSFSPVTENLNKQFAYATLTYLITEKIDATVMGYFNKTETNIMMNKGLYGIDFCAGYHVNDNVTLKGQIRKVMTDKTNAIVWNDLMSGIACSVLF